MKATFVFGRLLPCLVIVGAAWGVGAATTRGGVNELRVTTDRTVDSTSLETIVRDVIRLSGAKTNDEKAIALYEWLHNTIFHYGNAQEPGPQKVGPLKVINVYGWGLCGTEHTVLKALYETAGWECRYVGWSDPGHTTIEVKYDGRWHYLDVFLKCYFWTKDRGHIASQEEIAADPSIVLDAVKEGRAARQHLCCGDSAKAVISGVKSRNVVGDRKGWGACLWRDENYASELNLPAGAALRLEWASYEGDFPGKGRPAVHTCGIRDFQSDAVLGTLVEHYGPRSWSNGRLVYAPDFGNAVHVNEIALEGCLAHGGKLIAEGGAAAAVFKLPLPYLYVSGSVAAEFDGDGKLFVSSDQGKTWKPVEGGDLTRHIRQRYDVWLKADFAKSLKRLRLESVVEHNRYAQPYLLPGENRVTVSAGRQIPKGHAVTVTFQYQEATALKERLRFDGQGLVYSELKTVTHRATSLPADFVVDVAGNAPPKMIAIVYRADAAGGKVNDAPISPEIE